MSTLDSIKLESGYESNSLRSSSCGSYNKNESGDINYDIFYKRKYFNEQLKASVISDKSEKCKLVDGKLTDFYLFLIYFFK